MSLYESFKVQLRDEDSVFKSYNILLGSKIFAEVFIAGDGNLRYYFTGQITENELFAFLAFVKYNGVEQSLRRI